MSNIAYVRAVCSVVDHARRAVPVSERQAGAGVEAVRVLTTSCAWDARVATATDSIVPKRLSVWIHSTIMLFTFMHYPHIANLRLVHPLPH